MALTGLGYHPEAPTGAQFHVGHLHAVVVATHHYVFLTPVELEGFDDFAGTGPPGMGVVRDTYIALGVATGLDWRKQCACCTSVLVRAQRVGFESLLLFSSEVTKFAKTFGSNVPGNLHCHCCLRPFMHSGARDSGALCNCAL